MLGKVVVCADGEAACRPEGQLNRLWQNPGQSGWEFEVAGFKPNDDDRKWAQIVPFVLNSFSSHPKVKIHSDSLYAIFCPVFLGTYLSGTFNTRHSLCCKYMALI